MMDTEATPGERGLRILRRRPMTGHVRVHVAKGRPSLLDLRPAGDVWIVAFCEERFALLIGDKRWGGISGTLMDLQTLNTRLFELQHRRPRRR